VQDQITDVAAMGFGQKSSAWHFPEWRAYLNRARTVVDRSLRCRVDVNMVLAQVDDKLRGCYGHDQKTVKNTHKKASGQKAINRGKTNLDDRSHCCQFSRGQPIGDFSGLPVFGMGNCDASKTTERLQAIAANDAFIARLEEIRNRAQN
jgi:hypothetical protein